MKEAVDGVRGREAEFEDAQIRANIRDAVDAFDKEARKSSELAQKEAQLESEANQAWAAGRARIRVGSRAMSDLLESVDKGSSTVRVHEGAECWPLSLPGSDAARPIRFSKGGWVRFRKRTTVMLSP